MRRVFFVATLAVLFAFSVLNAAEEGKEMKMAESIIWLGHDGFLIKLEKASICIDPYKVKVKDSYPPADIILITHEHGDHMSPDDIAKFAGEKTVIIAAKDAAEKLKGAKALLPGEKIKIGDVDIEAVPAYNTNKKFHTKESMKNGYIVTIDGVRIYHAGDTDFIPEMKDIKCDIALLPVSGKYVMTAEEAVEAAKAIKPKIAIPMHYGSGVVGTVEDAKKFSDGLKGTGIEVVIKK